MNQPAHHDLVGATLTGRFHLRRLLGAGAMGAVYEAEGVGGEIVAVKVLSQAAEGGGSSAVARFLREGRLAASLSNEHLVHVHDGGVDAATGLVWLAMDLLRGEDLEQLSARLGPLDPRAAVRIALQAARGLAASHAAGVIHRDIKPSNLFLHEAGGVITVKICDFGLAKAVRSTQDQTQLTATNSIVGSPLYMAPEQILSAREVDPRADVWGLAMSLYQCLAGAPAFSAITTFSELAVAVTTGEVPHLQDAAPWVEPDLAQAIHGALIREVDARCPSVEALARALEAHAGDDDRLDPGMLLAVSDDVRARTARRAPYPLSWRVVAARAGAAEAAGGVDVLVGKELAGRYRLERLLGKGGMGAVYEARMPSGERVAVKVIGEAGAHGAEAQARFVREVSAVRAITSPHVVKVLEAGTDPRYGVPYLVMELLTGRDLETHVREAGPLDPAALAQLFVQVSEGLAAAHALGIIHRDLKPANIFLHELPDGTVTARLCDFGVAKQQSGGESDVTSSDLTRTGGMLGSPAYMSPEQTRNAKGVDARSDLWSLAISLHQALTGKKPWSDCTTVGDLIVAICTRPVVPVDELAPWVDHRLAAIVMRSLSREPADRHPDALAFAAALVPFASPPPLRLADLRGLPPNLRARAAGISSGSLPASTRPASTTDPPGPPARLSKGLLGAVGVVALAAGASAAVMAVGRHPADPPPATSLASPPSASAALALPAAADRRLRVRVPVSPAGVEVSVQGKPAAVSAAGEIELEGDPGDAFDVVLTQGKARREARVVLSKSGQATPPRLDLPTAASPLAPTHEAHGAPPAATPQATTAPAAIPATAPAATPKATAPEAGGKHELPRPKETW
jgi:serine/threonine protein kinase